MPSTPFYQPGPYVGEIISQALGKTKNGHSQFALRFKVLGIPEEDGYRTAQQQYERTIYWVITEKTIQYVAEKLNRLGYTGKGFGPLDPSHPNHQSFTGLQFDAYCQHQPDQNGELREKWDLSRGASELKIDPLSSKEVRDLDALFGKSLSANGPAPKPAAKTQPQPIPLNDGTVITDDDIPF